MTTVAYEGIRGAVLARIEQQRIDPDGHPDAVRAAVEAEVERYQRQAHLGTEPALHDPAGMVNRVLRSVTAYGPLTDLLASPDVEEIFIEGARVTFLGRDGRLQGLAEPTSAAENRAIIERLLAVTQRSLDTRHPLVQARVLGGAARLSAAIPPVADELSATIRKHSLRRDTLTGLAERGSLTPAAAAFLSGAMRAGCSVLVSGPPGAGKTSLLSALMHAIPAGRCVRVCEEIRELNVPLAHGSCYETRPPGLDGGAAIDLRMLVRFCLAMRPDVIVVGEVRGAEAFELTRAVNAGCGFACTIHANSARDALDALVNAAIMAGENVPQAVVRKIFAGALDLLVHLDLREGPDGLRREVAEVIAVVPALTEGFSTERIFVREQPGAALEWTGAVPPCAEHIACHIPGGTDLRALLEGRVGVP